MTRSIYRKKRRLRAKAALLLILLIIGLTAAAVWLYPHFSAKAHEARPTAASAKSPAKAKSPASAASAVSSAPASPVLAVQVSLEQAEKPLWIHVSIENQTLTVYDGENRVVESWLCSTGSPGYDTPKGTFTVYNRGKSFFSKKYQEGAYWWVAFYEDYYIHSVPFDKDKNIIPSVANDLGRQDSHGCVHLSVENSEWVYDNIRNGTKVVVD